MLFSLFGKGDGDESFSALKVNFTNYEAGKGVLYIRLGDENDELITTAQINLSNDESFFEFAQLKPGKYTLRCFQDLNGNELLDRNFIGIPQEPYGFANNPKVRFGPPSIKEQTIEIKDDKSLVIRLKR